jgi:hypothetical protein
MELEQHIRCAGNKNITTPKNNNAVILGGVPSENICHRHCGIFQGRE